MPEINVQDVPPGILRRLSAEARREDVGISTMVNRILADAFDVAAGEERAGNYRGGGASSTLVVTVSDEVRAELRLRGPGQGGTIRSAVLNVLAERYGFNPRQTDRRSERGGRKE